MKQDNQIELTIIGKRDQNRTEEKYFKILRFYDYSNISKGENRSHYLYQWRNRFKLLMNYRIIPSNIGYVWLFSSFILFLHYIFLKNLYLCYWDSHWNCTCIHSKLWCRHIIGLMYMRMDILFIHLQ